MPNYYVDNHKRDMHSKLMVIELDTKTQFSKFTQSEKKKETEKRKEEEKKGETRTE